ncbi:hypothetical protein B0H14DRAFT_3477509 [Mycena olivaceomarginata]|nr:hypothetical protein B0H14DRAFT_3477509 [Mycena olivaceomarginata]
MYAVTIAKKLTHAIRNPGKAVQQVRHRPTASGAAKATASLKKEEARLQRRAYEQDIEAFNEHRDREIARIAKKYGKTDRYVRGVLCHKSSVKTTRRKNLRNAIKYDRALKARAAGEQKSLEDYHNDLQDEIDDGAAFDEQSLGKIEYERLMDQLEEKRQTETRGARATNKAAANDARKTSMSIGEQLTNLYERTGVRAFAIFSRGNADDDSLPQAVDSDNALEFFLQEMGTDQLDVMRKFEHLLVHHGRGRSATRKKNDSKSVRADMSKRLTKGLQMILRNTKVVMEYAKYDVVICGGHGVEMAGWPKDVPVERAGTMNAETVRRILRMILAGEIRWVSMSKEARAALIKEQDAQRAESGGTQRSACPHPRLSHSPSVLDDNVSRIPSTTHAPPVPSTAAATTAASNAASTSPADLDLIDLLQIPNDGLVPDLNFDLDFLNISNDMAAAFPEMMGMQPLTPGYYGNTPGPSSASLCADLGLPALPRPTPSPHQVGLNSAGRQHGLEAHRSSPGGGCKQRGSQRRSNARSVPTPVSHAAPASRSSRIRVSPPPYALRFTAPTCLHPRYHIY